MIDEENVTVVPAQIVDVPLIVMVGVTVGVTVNDIAFEVAGLFAVQESEDVIIHVMVSPLVGELNV